MAVIFLDWSSYELMAILSGYFGVTSQAAWVILENILAVMFMIAYGIQSSSCAIVGAHIGAGRIESAKLYFKSILALSSIILVIELILLLTFRKEIFTFFTENEDI